MGDTIFKITSISLLASVIFAYFKLKDTAGEESAQGQSAQSFPTKHRRAAGSQEGLFDFRRSLLGLPTAQAKFKDWALSASQYEIAIQSHSIVEAYRLDPDGQYPMAAKLFHSMAEQDPLRVLWMLEHITDLPHVSGLEKEILSNWVDRDLPAVMKQVHRPKGVDQSHFLSLITSLAQNERKELLPQLLEIGDHLIVEKDATSENSETRLQWSVFIDSLARNTQPETLEAVAEYVAKHSQDTSSVQALANLVPPFIESSPSETFQWLRALDIGDQNRAELYSRAMLTLVEKHPEEATKLLDRENFLKEHYQEDPKEPNSPGRAAYDMVLQTFIYETMHHDPQVAVENTNLFFDPSSREHMKNEIENMVLSQTRGSE